MTRLLYFLSLLVAASAVCTFAAENAPVPLFPDQNLQKAIRQFVFEKRDKEDPLVADDVSNLSTIKAANRDISSLAGLEKCVSLASLEIARNDITDLSPLKEMDRLQLLDAAKNEIEDISPLSGVTALQYLQLSANRIQDISPLRGLTNMAALYLSTNYISDISALTNLPKLSSLYLQKKPNQLRRRSRQSPLAQQPSTQPERHSRSQAAPGPHQPLLPLPGK